MTDKPYQQIEQLAASLRQDGRLDWAEILLNAHEGIFNGTELYFTWIGHLQDLLRKKHLTQSTKLQAENLLERLGRDLDPEQMESLMQGRLKDTDDNIFPDSTKR